MMKLILILIFSLYASWCNTQVPVSQIEGLLEIVHPLDTTALYLGKNAGANLETSAIRSNSVTGYRAGETLYTATGNSLYGFEAGDGITNGNYNSFLGYETGKYNHVGHDNTFIGYQAGLTMGGDHNVCIGAGAGPDGFSVISNRLYVDIQPSNAPLINGNFAENTLRINGKVGVDGEPEIKLQVHGDQSNDAGLSGGGFLLLGEANSTNIVMDNNEIMARSNGQTAPLYFNHQGGNIHMFQSGSGDLFVHGIDAGNYASLKYNSSNDRIYYNSSTRKSKSYIAVFQDDWSKILSIRPRIYTRPNKPERREIGYLAEELDSLGLTNIWGMIRVSQRMFDIIRSSCIYPN